MERLEFNNIESVIFLGDIHGDMRVVKNLIKDNEIKNSIIFQVGDFGVGFSTIRKEKKYLQMFQHSLIKNNNILLAIRGNHDNPEYFENDPFELSNIKLLPDYSVVTINGVSILGVGGACSTDRIKRKENRDWWSNETFVLNESIIRELRDISIVVTHNAPLYCKPFFEMNQFLTDCVNKHGDSNLREDLIRDRENISKFISILKENNDIKEYYHGHFHFSNIDYIDDTKYILLDINEFKDTRLI